jgi:RNA polymerase sigma factor (sigma-70 family)
MDDDTWLTELFQQHYARIGRYISYKAPDLDVDNLTGQVFCLATENCEDIRQIPKPELWLLTTARNLIFNEIRKTRRWATLYGRIGPRFVTRVTDDHADEVIDSDRLTRALARLSRKNREIVYLIAYHHLNTGEIAEVLGMSRSSVAMRLHRLRAQVATPSGQDDAKPLTELVDRRS